MNLWLISTAMIAVAAIFAATPFIRRYERKRIESEKSLAVYRDQLKEVDLEAAQGALEPAQAEATRTEIKRRMLSTGGDGNAQWAPLSSGERTIAAVAASFVVVLGSVFLFGMTGDFEPPTRGAASNTATESAPPTAAFAALSTPSSPRADAAQPAAAGSKTPLPSVDELVQRLVTRLQRNPKDVEGWRMLGWSYFSLSRYGDAAAAYARAIELNPDSAEYRDGRMESLIRAAGGKVTGEAKAAMDETLKLHPKDSRALYVKGLLADQSGDRATAEQIWNDLRKDLDPLDPWAKEIADKLDGGGKGDSAQPTVASEPSAPVAAPDSGGKGPTADQVRAAESMSSSDRSAMIQRMVGSLADRLEKSPRDADGWVKLIRSWMVLGEADKAKLALESALKVFADDPEQSGRILAAADASGVKR